MTADEFRTADEHRFHRDYLHRIPITWGDALIDDIPLPPFRNRLEYDVFLLHLRRHLAGIEECSSSISTALALDMLRTSRDRRPSDREIHLTTTELVAAFLTGLPARWSVDALAVSLAAVGMTMTKDRRGRWTLDAASKVTARPASEGGWHTTVFEPAGARRCYLDHREFIVMLMQQLLSRDQDGPPCPFGWALSPADLRVLIPPAIVARLAYAHDVLDPTSICWIAQHARAYAANSSSLTLENVAEFRRVRALASARAQDRRRGTTIVGDMLSSA